MSVTSRERGRRSFPEVLSVTSSKSAQLEKTDVHRDPAYRLIQVVPPKASAVPPRVVGEQRTREASIHGRV